jgi:hypothetical protein
MKTESRTIVRPAPSKDWICQRELARLLGISERTASIRAQQGKLDRYRHGVPGMGRKAYSRELVQRDLQRRWEEAIRNQEEEIEVSRPGRNDDGYAQEPVPLPRGVAAAMASENAGTSGISQ